MSMFLVVVKLPEIFTDEFIELIPGQRALVDKLLLRRIILSYSLAADRGHAWIVFDLSDEENVVEVMSGFPIINHISYDITELAFHNSATYFMPQFSLN